MAVTMTPETLTGVAERFRALGDPSRLAILHALHDGELRVSDLVDRTGQGQASVSRHLGVLLRVGLVTRRRDGAWAWYRAADEDVWALCDLVCGRLERERQRHLALPPHI